MLYHNKHSESDKEKSIVFLHFFCYTGQVHPLKGHSTAVSILVSKTSDLGSIPSAPAKEKRLRR